MEMKSKLVVILLVATFTTVSSASKNSTQLGPSKAVKSICGATDYRDACELALSSASNSATNFTELVMIACDVTISNVKGVFNQEKFDQDAARDKRTADAIGVCKELLSHAQDDLEKSLGLLSTHIDSTTIMEGIDDLKVWLGAALGHQEACIDAFQGASTSAATKMRRAMKKTQKLTSNLIAIVAQISHLLDGFNLHALFGEPGGIQSSVPATPAARQPSPVTATHKRLLLSNAPDLKPSVTVAKDGSGDVKTIGEALLKVPTGAHSLFVIHIKEGVYAEQVHVTRLMSNVMLVGDGPTKTKITGNRNFADGTPVFLTATVAVVGDGFVAKDLGIENSAGVAKHEAVALRVMADMAAFYNCQIDGYQNTLFAHTKRQFYRDCTITGTKYIIFGTAPVVLQNCNILLRHPGPNDQNIITAQGRFDRRDPGATVLHNCTIKADPTSAAPASSTYLGTPVKPFSRTYIIQSFIDSVIQPIGWVPFMDILGLDTCDYTEVANKGPGSDTSKRVTWSGYNDELTLEQVDKFSVKEFLKGDSWLPTTNVPFTATFSP